jgi:hypothetical protein
MSHQQIQTKGRELAYRVRNKVETERRLDAVVRKRRPRIAILRTIAATSAVAILIGVTLFLAVDETPVSTQPVPITTMTTASIADLRPLPIEVFLVVVGDYKVATDSRTCTGSASLSYVREGLRVSLAPSGGEAPLGGDGETASVEVVSMVLPVGQEMLRADAPLFLIPQDRDAGCVFTLGTIPVESSYVELVVPGGIGSHTSTRSGQRRVTVIAP